MESGDLLVMFTDGVSETQREPEEFFGRERLASEIRSHREQTPEELIQHIYHTLQIFQGDQPQHDDVTMVIVSIG